VKPILIRKPHPSFPWLLVLLLLLLGLRNASAQKKEHYLFGWGYQDEAVAKPRGGTTKGAEVEYAPAREPPLVEGKTPFAKDREAILSMAGDYRVSFHFMETLGLVASYTNSPPYFSWATERVHVLEEREDFISLQHTLVMFFAEPPEGQGPMLTKHWRQDWKYQDAELHVYKGDRTWERERRAPESVSGTWTQAVFQVDDSPRYEALGHWKHVGNLSHWISEQEWRPLPRREFSVRTDYDALAGRHQIVITPSGWVHQQENWKLLNDEASEVSIRYLAQEWGINRYERILKPSLDAATEYWKKTGLYWEAVRQTWDEIMKEHDRFRLKPSVDGKSLFQIHFAYAEELAQGKTYDAANARRHARETVLSFLETSQ
jgi:hypothetical protein